jgi:hypothetical protein
MPMREQIEGARGWLRELGFAGERRAIALLPLCLFGLLYFVLALNAAPGWGPALFGLSLSYLVAFFALASGWFWARWYASGLGWSGFMVGIMALTLLGWQPALAIYGGLHGLIVLMLLGPKMAARYELRTGWRERFAMDEFGVARLGKAVTRGAGALPTLILWALAPREESADLLTQVGPGPVLVFGLGLLLVALVGLVYQRSVALLALFGAAAFTAAVLLVGGPLSNTAVFPGGVIPMAGPWVSSISLAFLAAAFAPWARPVARFLARQ